jgi:hypothetical protein
MLTWERGNYSGLGVVGTSKYFELSRLLILLCRKRS